MSGLHKHVPPCGLKRLTLKAGERPTGFCQVPPPWGPRLWAPGHQAREPEWRGWRIGWEMAGQGAGTPRDGQPRPDSGETPACPSPPWASVYLECLDPRVLSMGREDMGLVSAGPVSTEWAPGAGKLGLSPIISLGPGVPAGFSGVASVGTHRWDWAWHSCVPLLPWPWQGRGHRRRRRRRKRGRKGAWAPQVLLTLNSKSPVFCGACWPEGRDSGDHRGRMAVQGCDTSSGD